MVGLYREKLCPRPEYAVLGSEASVSIFRTRSQFFPIRTSQPINNIYVLDAKLVFQSLRVQLHFRSALVHTQPLLSLVLACLKGQEDQREGLLSSISRQLSKLLAAPVEVHK